MIRQQHFSSFQNVLANTGGHSDHCTQVVPGKTKEEETFKEKGAQLSKAHPKQKQL